MEFRVLFEVLELPDIKETRIIKPKGCNYGLEYVDLVRTRFNSDIPIKDIDYSCYYASKIDSYSLTENDIMKCPNIFYDTNFIRVFIVPFSFQKYLKIDFFPIYSRTLLGIFKKLSCVKIKESLDWSRIIDDWILHGCPLIWDPTKLNGTPDQDILDFVNESDIKE